MRAESTVTLNILRCQFDANIIDTTGEETGGGALIVDSGALVTIQDASFTNNQANSASGGALLIKSNDTTVTNCSFQGNSAKFGGGIGNDDSSPTITNCSFQGNSANFGGGFECFVSSPTLRNCSFQGNSASSAGGGDWEQLILAQPRQLHPLEQRCKRNHHLGQCFR